MSVATETERRPWIGVREAAEILSCSPYSIQKYAIHGVIRSRLVPPYKTLYSREDVETVARACDASWSAGGVARGPTRGARSVPAPEYRRGLWGPVRPRDHCWR